MERTFKNPLTGSSFTVAQVQAMIDKINDEGTGLDTWEIGFMGTMNKVFPVHNYLSVAQLQSLENIYAQKTP